MTRRMAWIALLLAALAGPARARSSRALNLPRSARPRPCSSAGSRPHDRTWRSRRSRSAGMGSPSSTPARSRWRWAGARAASRRGSLAERRCQLGWSALALAVGVADARGGAALRACARAAWRGRCAAHRHRSGRGHVDRARFRAPGLGRGAPGVDRRRSASARALARDRRRRPRRRCGLWLRAGAPRRCRAPIMAERDCRSASSTPGSRSRDHPARGGFGLAVAEARCGSPRASRAIRCWGRPCAWRSAGRRRGEVRAP